MAQLNGPNLKAARERKHLSRAQLAELVDQSYVWVWFLENEKKGTPREKLCRLADVLGVPVAHIERTESLEESA